MPIIGRFLQLHIDNQIIRNPDLSVDVRRELIGEDAARDIEDVAAGKPRAVISSGKMSLSITTEHGSC